MNRRPGSTRYSRRAFLHRTGTTGAVLSLSPDAASKAAASKNAIIVHAAEPAGPPPFGALVETSIPFERGRLRDSHQLAILSTVGTPVPAQFRTALQWPDGSIRWLAAAFEASAGPGDYLLISGQAPGGPDLVSQSDGRTIINTGCLALAISAAGRNWIHEVKAPARDGTLQMVAGTPTADLVITGHDGKQFRASLDGATRRVAVEERGPLRAVVLIEGQCRSADGEGLFHYQVRCKAFRDRAEAHFEVTWINATGRPSEKLRDIRLVFPFGFEPDRLVFGCNDGIYDGPFLKDWPVWILQEDHNWYWARTLNPDGRTQNLSSGGCNGEHAPGWLYAQNRERCLGVWVPQFHEEYPNEIAIRHGELSVGLWPERAVNHLLSKPLLNYNAQGTPYQMSKYWPILPHPYWAFLDKDQRCLDVRQGVAKTQQIVLGVWAGHDETPGFEARWWKKSLRPVRGHLQPAYVRGTGAIGPLTPRGRSRFPEIETMFDESFAWLDRHIDFMKCYGKFDYGDFKYFTASTTYLCNPGTKWGAMGEMAREGYWQNNEGDQLLGLLNYYFRTADPVAWERCGIVARHLLDVDMRHHPYFGLYTHGYGHCYVETARAGEPDHSWLLGLLVWAGASGDPTAWNWLLKCGDYLAALPPEAIQGDARTASVLLHMLCEFHGYTGADRFRTAAEVAANILLEYQNADGSWPAYLGNPERRAIVGFTDHALMALASYYSMTGADNCVEPLHRACQYTFGTPGIADGTDISLLSLFGAAVFDARSGSRQYARAVLKSLEKLRSLQNRSSDPYGRGDTWAKWGVNEPERAKGTGRPPQFLGQTRPLSAGFILAYGQPALALVAGEDRKS